VVARLVGLDVGSKRIGLALSDELGCIASPRGVIRRVSYNKDAAAIAMVVEGSSAERVVVGLPLGLSGADTDQTRRVQRFAEMLASRLEVPVDLWDERLTTRMAVRLGHRDRRDEVAAALILQGYLDRRKAEAPITESCEGGDRP
jgi:putative Holliday junction resolvase